VSEPSLPTVPERPAQPTYFDPNQPDVQVNVKELFGPNFKDGVVEVDYLLCTRTPKSMYRRDFVYLSRLLYSMERYRAISIVDEGKLDAAEALVIRKLDSVRQLISKNLREAKALISANAHQAHSISYPRAMRYRAPIVSPYAREYMEILRDADEVYSQLEVAFLLGLIERVKRRGTEALMRKSIRAISAVVRQVRIETVKYMDSLRTKTQDMATRDEIAQITQQDAATLAHEGKSDTEVLGSVSGESDLTAIAGSATPLPTPGGSSEAPVPAAA
jgi:hypothetical protein